MPKPRGPDTDVFLARTELRRLGGLRDIKKAPDAIAETVELELVAEPETEAAAPDRGILRRFSALRDRLLPPVIELPASEKEDKTTV